jgi:hypothetical protein
LWIENSSGRDLACKAYFHFPLSSIGVSSTNDAAWPDVPDYYMNIGIWRNAELGVDYGAAPVPSDARIACTFYKDDAGREHPDCRRAIDVKLKPGRRWAPAQPEPTMLIAGRREANSQPFPLFVQALRDQYEAWSEAQADR